ncbi:MAG: bifunctional (p)ppGpp synthetase/guanosine-3',5'-bis(diphosphate) 3'-pyrophosphohydrolase [Clostridia bacterium]|nr:bifunctional (p)ppGpp synthetase/guanosine-3',5'-bis(diphosphate) 3'-pyrophosphohydrolase [Clostridia bacterium]
MEEYEVIYENIVNDLKKKHALDIGLFSKAYEFAKKFHKGQYRKSGEPYILHPVKVAEILNKLDFDVSVLCAGLLHDTVEDCEYTIDQLKADFNKSIAQIVDAVTAIELDFDKYSDDDFPKFIEESQTYNKLLSIGKENLFAFYIKFADRLNNLQTISCFPRYKQLDKIKETEKWLLPLLHILKANWFYREISNEIFKIRHQDHIERFDKIYEKYFLYNKKNFEELTNNLTKCLTSYFQKSKQNYDVHKISIKPCTQYETFSLISEIMDVKKISDVKQSYLNKFPISKLYIMLNSNLPQKELNDILFKILTTDKMNLGLKICGYNIEPFSNQNHIIVSDQYRNKYQVFIFNLKDYLVYRNGTSEGIDFTFMEENTEEVSSNFIKVKTRSNQIITLQDPCTVLDFAFKIHKDFGFSVKYAYLNDSPVKSPIYTKLSDGDKIHLVLEKDENDNCINISQLRWIMYAKTENAQRKLIRYFEGKL